MVSESSLCAPSVEVLDAIIGYLAIDLRPTALTNNRRYSSQGRLGSLSIHVKYLAQSVGHISSSMYPG
nr:hypothetical protein CFP56_73147 [Quercus suber]